jgi:hypothetical protein
MKITEMRIENDLVNNLPTVVFVTEDGKEWVNEQDGAGWIRLVEKQNSWYFKSKENGQEKK